jgi:hypothetical protein
MTDSCRMHALTHSVRLPLLEALTSEGPPMTPQIGEQLNQLIYHHSTASKST